MKRILICVLFAAAMMVGVPGKADAASFTFTLDCTVNALTCPIGGGPFGTVLIEDDPSDANWVKVTIDMNGGLLPHLVNLNWNTAVYGCLPDDNELGCAIAGDWAVTAGVSVLKYDTDNAGAFGRLDISVWDIVGTLADPLTFSIRHSGFNGGNLNPEMFVALDELGQIYTAVRVGSSETDLATRDCVATTSTTGCYGATGYVQVSTQAAAVPEPGTLGLLGMGLLAAAGAARRTLRKS